MDLRGKRLLASTVDHLADRDPGKSFAVVARGPDITDGFETLQMKDVRFAVDSLCWWLEEQLGASHPPETLAFIGSNDVRYCFLVLACQKMGHKPFLPSIRNSNETTLQLLKATDCTKIFYSKEKKSHILDILELDQSLESFQIPSTRDILEHERGLQPYPWTPCYADMENKTACIIHSSGTTGPPKPVHLTHGFFATMDASTLLPWPPGRRPNFPLDIEGGSLATTPFFHIMGLVSFVMSIFHGTPVIIGPDKPPSVNYLVGLMRATCPAAAAYAPSILEALSRSDEALKCLCKLRYVFVGGAPLAKEIGDLVSKHTRVVSMFGSSEVGWIPGMVPADKAHWAYYEWNPAYGVEMQDMGNSMFELVIPRKAHSKAFHSVFHTFPQLESYRTGDLFTQHSTLPHLWKFYGRRDNLIVLSNGEKFNPVPMEKIIESHPLVRSAVIVGHSRFEAALLVEPVPDAYCLRPRHFVEEIWPSVQAANQTSAGHARIMRARIKVASPDKPFKRTPKDTTQRRAVLRDYETEINDVYAADLAEHVESALPETLDLAGIQKYARRIVFDALGKSVSDEEDLYAAGLDSLMTIQLSSLLQKAVRTRWPHIKDMSTPQVVYENPTIRQLSEAIFHYLGGHTRTSVPRQHRIQNMVHKYIDGLPEIQHGTGSPTKQSPSTILLTGSTGSLGTYLLHSLLSCPTVTKVYCLTRSDEAYSRQIKSLEEKGFCIEGQEWSKKMEFLKASFGEPNLGLDETRYAEMLASVDTIIHAAWALDFNQTLGAFEGTHIMGVRQLLDFSIRSTNHAHIHFISSVGTVAYWSQDMGSSVPEAPIQDSSCVVPNGYSESKHVAERICLEATRRSGIAATVYRVGQVAGPTTLRGKWSPQEWLPTLVQTSKATGKVPRTLGSAAVDWIPVDTLSTIILELVRSRHTSSASPRCAFFHLTNPSVQPWSSLIPAIEQAYKVKRVECGEWLSELESIQDPSPMDVMEKPALKLLPLYRGLFRDSSTTDHRVVLDTRQSREKSGTMQSMGPVTPAMMDNWLRQWDF